MRLVSRLGYIALVLAILCLGWYVFRPVAEGGPTWVKIYDGPIPTTYVVRANGLVQEVKNAGVTVNGWPFAVDEEKANGLWNQLQVLSTTSDKIIEGIAPADYAAYGLDPERRAIVADSVTLLWGNADGQSYVVNQTTGTLAVVPPGVDRQINALCGRLDRQQAMPPNEFSAVTVNGVRFERQQREYVAALNPLRPPVTNRARSVGQLLNQLSVSDLNGKRPDDAKVVARAVVEYDPQDVALHGYASMVDLEWYTSATGPGWQARGWPAQAISSDELQLWQTVCNSFAEDRLYNLGNTFFGLGIDMIQVFRGDTLWFSIENNNARQLDDLSSNWDVVWDGGREYADPQGVEHFVEAMNSMSVGWVQPRVGVSLPWPQAVRIIASGKGLPQPVVLEVRDRQVRSGSYMGWAEQLPQLLGDIRPDRFLDPVIASRAPERVTKVQRRLLDRTPPLEETFVCDARGVWNRVYPGPGPVDQVAVQRMARAMAAGTARSVSLATDADRALAETRTLEVAVRFAPKDEGKANDFTDLDETTTIDVGLAMQPLANGDGWRALSIGTGIVYEVDDDFAAIFQVDAASPLVLPLIPALVNKIIITEGTASAQGAEYSLTNGRTGWQLQIGNGQSHPAADVEVRRFLRDLSSLTASRRIDGIALMAQETAYTVSVLLPGTERELTERLSLQIGKPGMLGAGPDECVVYAESTRLGALVPKRSIITVEQAQQLSSPAQRFQAAP